MFQSKLAERVVSSHNQFLQEPIENDGEQYIIVGAKGKSSPGSVFHTRDPKRASSIAKGLRANHNTGVVIVEKHPKAVAWSRTKTGEWKKYTA